MKKAVNILNRILSIILVLVLLLAGYIFITVLRAGKDTVPSVFGFSFLQVATGSMEPTIPIGTIIVVRQTDAALIKEGDVICFYSSDPMIHGKPNTHRVVRIEQDNGRLAFITMGDAAEEEDPYPVYPDQLIGVYVFKLRTRNIAGVLHSPYFFFFALLVPLCVVVFVELLSVKKSAEEKKEKANGTNEKSE